MKKTLIINALLLVLVLGLGAFLFFKPKPEEPKPVEHKLSTLKPEEIKRIEVKLRRGDPVVLELEGEQWYLTKPFRARADNFEARRLADLVRAVSDQKLPATDLARFELEPPFATVMLDKQTFTFGTINRMMKMQYVMTGDSVYMVNPQYAQAIPPQPERMADNRLWTTPEQQITGVEMPGFKVEQVDGNWAVSPKPLITPTQDDLNRFIDEWKLASGTLTQPMKLKPGKDATIVRTKDGKAITVHLASREGNDWIVLRPDEGLQYHLSRETARRMFEPNWR
ncbi:MAG: DUF4340 domain-containing protein [Rhodocyclaceae bacterium]|nr:DUF4340 domain-containing protein [Rhodocyclaceae bacterium]MCA3075969.1 DUF4340 domain-containing protein [Rhodocyclaceae bacterium]MCA3091952.1 DUF4340 domain-containing protein [Rhodocyclaceae bacterium]MCA3095125.1 DUF4340 domain-containing protein [Rhodocyclaceae bacterium]MCA3096530.1 DUF4340 domain-containing protein [Rhodocyclaceae bacterium]